MSATLQLVERCKALKLKLEHTVTYFPFMSELKGKYIKFIDICDQVAEDEEGHSYITSTDSLFINLIESHTNELKYNDFSLKPFCLSENKQNRILLNFQIDAEQSFIQCNDSSLLNKYVYILFWYSEDGDVNQVSENENMLYSANSFEVLTKEQKNFFGDNREIYAKRFVNFMLYAPAVQPQPGPGEGESAGQLTQSAKTYNNNTAITETDTYSLFLTLVRNNVKILDSVPLYVFLYKHLYNILTFNKIVFDFTLSYITTSASYSSDAANKKKAVMFNAIYED